MVVTRYFGGTLLGTGGLVRAYSGAVQEGLKNSTIVEKCPGRQIQITTDYTGIGKIQYILGQNKIPVLDSKYTDQVEVSVMAPLEREQQLKEKITEATCGRARLSWGSRCIMGFWTGRFWCFEPLFLFRNSLHFFSHNAIVEYR